MRNESQNAENKEGVRAFLFVFGISIFVFRISDFPTDGVLEARTLPNARHRSLL